MVATIGCDVIVHYGVVTWYAIAAFAGGPLYCGGTFDVAAEPWIAMPSGGNWQCGDQIVIWSGGQVYHLRARDCGPFDRYCVIEGDRCLPIVGDLPDHLAWWPGLSTRAVVINGSQAKRRLEIER